MSSQHLMLNNVYPPALTALFHRNISQPFLKKKSCLGVWTYDQTTKVTLAIFILFWDFTI